MSLLLLSGSEHIYPKFTLSSFNHFSKSCLRPCWRTGLQSSRDSYLFSCPWSSRMPKYWSKGEVCPGWAGTAWNRRMVSGVRRIPCQKQMYFRFLFCYHGLARVSLERRIWKCLLQQHHTLPAQCKSKAVWLNIRHCLWNVLTEAVQQRPIKLVSVAMQI